MAVEPAVLAVLAAAAAGWVVLAAIWPRARGREAAISRPRWRPGESGSLGREQLPAAAAAAGAGLLAYAISGLIAPAVVVAAMGWGASAAVRRWRRARRAAALSAALISAVDLLGQLLPAGHSTRQALLVLAESGPLELRDEVAAIVSRLDRVSLEAALIEAEDRLRQPLFTLLASALIVGNRSGGRLAPLLQELGRAAHQVEAVQGQLRAEQAQGRLGALVIAVLPLVLLGVMHVVNPEYLAPYSTAQGELLLGLLLGLILLGYVWMLRILRLPEPDLLPLAPALPRGRGPAAPVPGVRPSGAGARPTPRAGLPAGYRERAD